VCASGTYPAGHVHRQRQPPVRRTRQRDPAQRGALPIDVDMSARQRGIAAAVAATVLTGQRQLRDRPHRPVRAQCRLGQLEQCVRPPGQALVELLPERGQLPGRAGVTGVMQTDQLQPLARSSVCRKRNDRPRASLMISGPPPTIQTLKLKLVPLVETRGSPEPFPRSMCTRDGRAGGQDWWPGCRRGRRRAMRRSAAGREIAMPIFRSPGFAVLRAWRTSGPEGRRGRVRRNGRGRTSPVRATRKCPPHGDASRAPNP
jgi:hypothetical protein